MAQLDHKSAVAIAAFGNSTERLRSAITQFSKPVWLLTNLWASSFNLYPGFCRKTPPVSEEVAIFLPWPDNLPLAFAKDLNTWAIACPQIHWVISAKDNAAIDSKMLSDFGACQVVTVSPTVIEGPVNGFNRCAEYRRKDYVPYNFLRLREGDFKRYPRNLELTVTTGHAGAVYRDASVSPEVSAVLAAYAALNTTLQPLKSSSRRDVLVLEERRAHFSLYPKASQTLFPYIYYYYALYKPCQMCFFAQRVPINYWASQLSASRLFVLAVLISSLGAAVMFVYILSNNSARWNLTILVMFMVSTLFGRAPPCVNSKNTTTKILLACWAIGTFFVGSFILSDVTAETYTSTFHRQVESVNDLNALSTAKKMFPCIDVNIGLDALRRKIRLFSAETLRALSTCKGCLNFYSPKHCIRLAQRGTHAYIRPCCPYDDFDPNEWGLMRSGDSFFMYQRQVLVLRNMHLRHQHRRVLLAVAESGMDSYEARKVGRPPSERREVPFVTSNRILFWAYVSGCSIAGIALCLEVIEFKFSKKS
ncbi:hypothetical protein HPB48_006481 [Haemaphysalis longicornis]|uniref:Ionotropic receptor n=1 Tax=Haemaphysalis longicornis TaxID=44386 RepID=A0A9J6FKN7_HAELO|nr:hypothetical protein HPB48_006481 [Haemaphysalis longicornis]